MNIEPVETELIDVRPKDSEPVGVELIGTACRM